MIMDSWENGGSIKKSGFIQKKQKMMNEQCVG